MTAPKVWNGSAFVDANDYRVWNGSVFAKPKLFDWDGANFRQLWPPPWVEFDAVGAGISGGGSTRSWLHTINGNTFVAVFTNTTLTAADCTVGGFSVPRVFGPSFGGSFSGFNSYVSIFAVVDNSLPQGSQTVQCTQGATAAAGNSVSFRNGGSLLVTADGASGNVAPSVPTLAGQAAVAGYVGGGNNFGAALPNEFLRYNFSAFVTWATLGIWGTDGGLGINFTSVHSGAKSGAVVRVLPVGA